MFATEKVIVYRSQAEEAFDNFVWSESGAIFFGSVLVSALIVGCLLAFLYKRD